MYKEVKKKFPTRVLGRIVAMLVQGCLGLFICKDTGIAEQQALAAELGMDVYVAGTLMFPDERGKQDDRAVRIAKTHGVRVALASFAGPTGGGYAMSGRQFGDLGS